MRALLQLRALTSRAPSSPIPSSFHLPLAIGSKPPKRHPPRKVAILGAASSIGQRLAFLMNLSPLVSNLSLHDTSGSLPMVAYGNHFTTRPKVVGYLGKGNIGQALTGSDLVVISGSSEVKSLCTAIIKHCPHAIVNIVSDAETSVPIALNVFNNVRKFNANMLLGVIVHDGDIKGAVKRNAPSREGTLSKEGSGVVELTAGMSLQIAYAGAVIADSCLRALNGIPDTATCSFVQPENFDNVELIFCVSDSETTADLMLERFEQWKSGHRLEVIRDISENKKDSAKRKQRKLLQRLRRWP